MSPLFPTTRRSVVLALASDDREERTRAFDTLVSLYWRPLYKYGRIASTHSPADCEDTTQSFFARLLENDALSGYDPAKGGFRTFLRVLYDRHSANEVKAAGRLKRGGGQRQLEFADAEAEIAAEAPQTSTPEEYFHREWVRSVFALAVDRLREETERAGKQTQFAIFEDYDLDHAGKLSYRDLAARFAIAETSVTNHLAAMRKQFREIVLDILREATASEQEFRSEARALLGVEP
ncbi:MAG: sigma-70 family RNA polymerase sigma factor [Thermoanaerobaculia bacterium]|nr:sigma-70 family RNA polymerase sigma factor [Thermoanaerobaculia bacterium]